MKKIEKTELKQEHDPKISEDKEMKLDLMKELKAFKETHKATLEKLAQM